MPINYQVMGLPIQTGTSQPISIAFVHTPVSLPGMELGQSIVFDLEVKEKHLEQLWNWTEPRLQTQVVELTYTQEKSWEQALEEVLSNRANTWKELAGL